MLIRYYCSLKISFVCKKLKFNEKAKHNTLNNNDAEQKYQRKEVIEYGINNDMFMQMIFTV